MELLHNMAELYLQSKLGSFLLLASYSRIAHVSLENIVGREWNNFLKIKYSKFPIISDPRKLLEVNKSPCFNANILQAHSVLLLPPIPSHVILLCSLSWAHVHQVHDLQNDPRWRRLSLMMMLHYREVCGVFLRSLMVYFCLTSF